MSEQVLRKKSIILSRMKLWARKVDLENKLVYVLFLGLLMSAGGAYALFSNAAPLSPTPDNLYIFV